jgi:hypothetical protein
MTGRSPRKFYLLGITCLLLAPLLWYGSDLAARSTAKAYMKTVLITTTSNSGETLMTALEHATGSTGIDGQLTAPKGGHGQRFFLNVTGTTETLASEGAQTLSDAIAADLAARSKPAVLISDIGPPKPIRAGWARPLMESGQRAAWGLALCGVVLLGIGYHRKGKGLPPRLPNDGSKESSKTEFDY